MKNAFFMNILKNRFATVVSTALCAVLFVCANTTSCIMVHQPESPVGLERFSKVK